jgi:hypothetical protein
LVDVKEAQNWDWRGHFFAGAARTCRQAAPGGALLSPARLGRLAIVYWPPPPEAGRLF